ncbi:hypothetical protein GDO78_008369 [Eleutherodactylus coqui]|uniref:Uncharacterized protein n=1 Tax=Eleutherodactylus coqui TaxID=57060 RepID=A0A8J6FDB8_ELECQ|nr:hypothetical protein GDO78_008369 [Eleutherodactylus coqui]
MSFLKKGLGAEVNTGDIVKQGKETVQEAANQCVQEGQKIAQEAIDKGCQAVKEAGDKAVDQLKTGIKYK